MIRIITLTLTAVLAGPAVAEKPADGIRPTPADTSTVPASDIEPRLDMDAVKEPPPSAWDLRQRERDAGEPPEEEGRQGGISWGEQLAKTVLALLIVVGLIYFLFRVGLAKFVGMAAIKGGKSMKVLERVQLDARHALLIVELDGERRFLLGTGEQGIQMLARLDRDQPLSPDTQASFQDAMKAANVADDRGDSEGTHA
jgi:flagellar biogenesis protein FliO